MNFSLKSFHSTHLLLPPALLTLASLSGCLQEPAPAPAPPPATARPAVLSWRVANAYLEDIFETIPGSSIDDFRKDIPEAERQAINSANGPVGLKDDNSHVYGEPAPATSDLMLKRLKVGEADVLYDFGCGRGAFLMQALLTTPMRKAVGVELSHSRLEVGLKARALLRERGLLDGKVLELHEQDMAQAHLDDATLVYMDSVFFSDQLLLTMAKKMSRAKNLRAVVMIMKGLPPNPWFELEGKERWKMSWSPRFGSEVLFYRRTSAPAD